MPIWYFVVLAVVLVGLIVVFLQIRKKQREDD